MHQSAFLVSLLAAFVSSAVLPREDGPPNPGMPTALSDQGLQEVPDEPKAPNTFNNGKPQDNKGLDWGQGPIPDLYQPKDIDIPFGRMYHGKMSFFDYGEYNNPKDNTATWSPNTLDYANQRCVYQMLAAPCYSCRVLTQHSACGIPDDSSFQTKAAIHPYFLKYAGLDRK